jgi:hypothetical protein
LKNELHPELLSLHSIGTLPGSDSGNRAVMFGSHFSQRLVINGAEEKIIQTGVEREMSKYTFAIRMPEDGRIVKIIERYPRGLDSDGIQFNPETLVIYEDDKTKELGSFSIPTFASFHQYFGFKYVFTEAMALIRPGNFIAKDTVFADSPSVGKNGAFKFGIPLNMALMTMPAGSEDGVAICSDVLPRLRFTIMETRTVEFGKNNFPINLYGSPENYKPHPDIGEYLREDGLLMVMRPYEKSLAPVEMSIHDTMEPDFTFDKGVYVRGGKGKVIDIVVHHDDGDFPITPPLMTVTTDKYVRAHKAFYRSLLDTERQIRSERRKKFGDGRVALKPELHRLMVEALSVCQENSGRGQQRIIKQHRKNPLDDYRITFTIEYEMTPTSANKITDLHGGI